MKYHISIFLHRASFMGNPVDGKEHAAYCKLRGCLCVGGVGKLFLGGWIGASEEGSPAT